MPETAQRPIQNRFFYMKVMLNKETEEICECCNISKDNLWQITHRAKLQLKACINQKLKHQL